MQKNKEDIITLAKTIYGEARGELRKEGDNSLIAVANVVINRYKEKGGRKSIKEICRAKKQFSCWNEGDPNLKVLERVDQEKDAIYKKCLEIAEIAVSGGLKDITDGANHYFAKHIKEPYWAKGKKPVKVIGSHIFYKL